jgi:DNA polymerase III subunit epsilon
MSLREIVFDTETTGLDPDQGDKLIEIGCVELIGGVQTGKTYHQFVNPERDIPDAATAIHGITLQQVRNCPVFGEIADDFLAFIGDAPLVAHNAEFDFKFINAELRNINRAPVPMSRMIDTMHMAKRQFPGARVSLDSLCARLGVDTSTRTKHGALIDSKILADVYIELLGGKQRGFELGATAASPQRADVAMTKTDKPYREPRSFAPSETEFAAHQAFLATMKKPMWLN